jgi:hypothetical protein
VIIVFTTCYYSCTKQRRRKVPDQAGGQTTSLQREQTRNFEVWLLGGVVGVARDEAMVTVLVAGKGVDQHLIVDYELLTSHKIDLYHEFWARNPLIQTFYQ